MLLKRSVDARRDAQIGSKLGQGRFLPSLYETVGATPLVELRRLAPAGGARIAVKLESKNPSGSVKDRVARALVEEAERDGRLRPGSTLVAATSSNTGIALAAIAAARGLRLELVIPEAWARERLALLLYLGATVTTTEGFGMQAARARARAIAEGRRDAVLLDQFTSPANVEVHRTATADELWQATGGEIDLFVAGIGTGGTLTGVTLGLRERGARVRAVGVEPSGSAILSGRSPGPHGIQGIGAGFVPPLLRRDLLDDVVTVTDQAAFDASARLATHEGILAGISSGASLAVALALASRPENAGRLIVTLICDSGERYVTTPHPPAPPSSRPVLARRGRGR